jgi:F-type H+-transporting ATPase subunit b
MNINATLILQSIAMMIFVWFCMKFLWPPLLKAMDERRERIAEGLAASDRAAKELESAKTEVDRQIREARDKAGEIVDQANQRHSQILDQAKEDASAERGRQVTAAEADIAQAANQAREELRASVASLAVLGASQILEKEVDANAHRELLDKLIAEI